MHRISLGLVYFFGGAILLLLCAYFWFNDIVKEAVCEGNAGSLYVCVIRGGSRDVTVA